MNVYAGPTRAMRRVTLRLVPLTPLHIGDGTEMRLDEYLIPDEPATNGHRYDEYGEEIEQPACDAAPELCRFDQAKAMRIMTAPERQAFSTALDAGRLGDAASALRKAGQRCIVERLPISARSAAELRQAVRDPHSRSGQVRPFIRSAGRPYIPGSSIKGALRTALASAALPRDTAPRSSWQHESALAAAFGLKQDDTSSDPLRFLHVGDAALPDGATLIDRAEVVKPGGAPASSGPRGAGIQMHYERSLALTDGSDAPGFDVPVAIDARATTSEVRRFEATFETSSLLSRCRAFHVKLLNDEMKRFFEGSKAELLRLLREHVSTDGKTPFAQQSWSPDFILLRLGRFGHFESKSLDGVRRGHFPQARNASDRIRQPDAGGQTRTVTRDAEDKAIPFGWVIGWVVKEERA